MASLQKSGQRSNALQQFRARLKREGFARVEVQVRQEDARLVRDIAQSLSNPRTEFGIRLALKACLDQTAQPSLKTHLLAQPYDELEFERSTDTGRTIIL